MFVIFDFFFNKSENSVAPKNFKQFERSFKTFLFLGVAPFTFHLEIEF